MYMQLSYGRETLRSLMLFRLTSSVIRKIMHKIGFLCHPIASGAIYALPLYLKFLTQRNLVAEFHQENVSFTRKTANSVFEPPFIGGLGVTYAIHLQLVGKLIVDFLLVIIEHFSLAITTDALIGRNSPLFKRVGNFGAKYQVEGRLPPTSIHRCIGEWF